MDVSHALLAVCVAWPPPGKPALVCGGRVWAGAFPLGVSSAIRPAGLKGQEHEAEVFSRGLFTIYTPHAPGKAEEVGG